MSEKDKDQNITDQTPKQESTGQEDHTTTSEDTVDEVENGENNDAITEEQENTSTSEGQIIEKQAKEIEELKDKYLRLFAEFENYKRRNTRERLDLIKTAGQETMSALLPVLDDFDRAKATADDENTEEEFSEGVGLVYEKLQKILQQKGLEKMVTTGEVFDPEIHEAITEIPAPDDALKGKIINTVEPGYKLNDKIIRFAKVVVGK